MATLNVGCGGGRLRDRAMYLGDVRIDVKPFPPVTVVMDAHHLGFRDSIFDKIYCFEVLEHLDSPIKALKEIKRVLTGNGTLKISLPNVWYWRRMYRALKNGFRILKESSSTDHKQAWDIYAFHDLIFQVGFRICEVQWVDWYPRGRRKLDPILGKILPAAFYFTHALFTLKKGNLTVDLKKNR